MNIIMRKQQSYCSYYLFGLHNHNIESYLCYRFFGYNENLGIFLTSDVYFFFLYQPLTLKFLMVIWTLSVLFIISKVWLRSQLVNKNPEKPTCIDLFLTNSPRHLQGTLTLETGLSDFHKMTVAAFKSEFPHQKLKMSSYGNYKHFDRNNVEKEIKIRFFYRRSRPKIFQLLKHCS